MAGERSGEGAGAEDEGTRKTPLGSGASKEAGGETTETGGDPSTAGEEASCQTSTSSGDFRAISSSGTRAGELTKSHSATEADRTTAHSRWRETSGSLSGKLGKKGRGEAEEVRHEDVWDIREMR